MVSSFPNCSIFLALLPRLALPLDSLALLWHQHSREGEGHLERVEVFSPQWAFVIWGTRGATVLSEGWAGVQLFFSKSCILLRCPSPVLGLERTGFNTVSGATLSVQHLKSNRTRSAPGLLALSSLASFKLSEYSCFYTESRFFMGTWWERIGKTMFTPPSQKWKSHCRGILKILS